MRCWSKGCFYPAIRIVVVGSERIPTCRYHAELLREDPSEDELAIRLSFLSHTAARSLPTINRETGKTIDDGLTIRGARRCYYIPLSLEVKAARKVSRKAKRQAYYAPIIAEAERRILREIECRKERATLAYKAQWKARWEGKKIECQSLQVERYERMRSRIYGEVEGELIHFRLSGGFDAKRAATQQAMNRTRSS